MLASRLVKDGHGNWVKRVDDNGTIHYVGNHYERNVGNGRITFEVVTKFYVTLANWLGTSYCCWGINYTAYGNAHYGLLYSIVAGSLQNLTYDYDPKGNVTSLGDGRNGETISFGYDHLDRLISASAPLNESYGYDNIGRMTTRNTSGYDYTGTYHAHAPRYVAGNYYDYDPNGNLITAEGRTYEYDAENRLIRVGACSSSVKRSLFHTKTLPARS